MNVGIKIKPNEGLYIREPQESKLGKNIIKHSILLINDIGFESFNFKKLSIEIGSTESSIYRYFENKHLLLLYLVSWYWEWVSYLIYISTINISDPKVKLKNIIKSLIQANIENPNIDYVNESILHRLVVSEGTKAFYTKEIDKENSKGFFTNYKTLVSLISEVLTEINPQFKYPNALASNLFEMSNNQIFYATHLPKLTDIKVSDSQYSEVESMLNYFVDRLLK